MTIQVIVNKALLGFSGDLLQNQSMTFGRIEGKYTWHCKKYLPTNAVISNKLSNFAIS